VIYVVIFMLIKCVYINNRNKMGWASYGFCRCFWKGEYTFSFVKFIKCCW